MCADLTLARRRQRGFSLIELMVSIVVALLVALAASGTAMFFTASQRQAMGTGGTVTNTATALSAIKEDLAQVGLGFFGDGSYLCSNLNLSRGATDFSTANFSPLQVVRGAQFDQLDVVYADNVAGGANVRIQLPGATAASAPVRSYMPAASSNAVLLAPAPGTANPTCTVRTVTDIVPSTTAGAVQDITYGPAGEHNQMVFAAPATYGNNDRAAVLGSLAWNRYSIVGSDLVITQRFNNTTAVLVRNVVGFRIQYGTAPAGGTTIVEPWQDAAGAWATLGPANLLQVRALRIGIVTRSPQPEKRDAGGNCTASETAPQLFGANLTGLPADWNCFRYRTSTVTVPLRNIAMGLLPI